MGHYTEYECENCGYHLDDPDNVQYDEEEKQYICPCCGELLEEY